MRAVQITRFGEPEVLDIVHLPDPVPGPGQHLYEVSAAGVNFADTHHPEVAHVRSGDERSWHGVTTIQRSTEPRLSALT
jgi:NADPH:quinone reductase-like Zn-dependent oxidoreductase